MFMKSGEQWHCTNPACRCEVLVQENAQIEGSNPRCVCGAPMKKNYSPPRFTYLNFLRLDEPVPTSNSSREA
jgi:hypothetical protein